VIHFSVPHPSKEIVFEYRHEWNAVDGLYVERTDLYTEWLWWKCRLIINPKRPGTVDEPHPIILSGLYGFLSDFLLRIKT
jgi:hypothetical protein